MTRRALPLAILFGGVLLSAASAAPRAINVPPFSLVAAHYRDLDGDLDPFPDSGETGRLVLTIRNGDTAFTGATLVLTSSDPGVDCISESRVAIGTLAPGQIVEVGSLDPAAPGLTLKVAASLTSASGAAPARIDLCARLKTDQSPKVTVPLCFFLPADLDLPAGAVTNWIAGPDGVPGTSDDGTLLENFDVDRDGDGRFTVNDTFRMIDAGTGQIGHGDLQRAAAQPGGSIFSGVLCAGYSYFAEQDCHLDPDFPMDWHLHCPPGAANCLNAESGPCNDGLPGAACTYATPPDGRKASSPPNSLHMGVHFAGRDSLWDTTRFRSVQAYRSGPINLTPLPRPGDLTFSMMQIADLMDDVSDGSHAHSPCVDCGDVQVQVDRSADPAIDDWGPWDKLAPFQNVYDHVPAAWSHFGDGYCVTTPSDTGAAPPAPNGSHQTLCYPQGAWSSCGSVRGTTLVPASSCEGPGVVDPSGSGVWVETRFDLSPFLGQRIRIRWVGETWAFDSFLASYNNAGTSWAGGDQDDGWWVDDVRVTGVLTTQTTPVPDARPAAGGTCPALCADIDGDGSGFPGSAACPAGPAPDCDDLRSDFHPGAPELCDGLDNDCDGTLPPAEISADGDPVSPCRGDCDDADPTVYFGAFERNDGKDNNCPGDRGYGIVDEISSPISMNSDTARIFWGGQAGATAYQLVRSTRADFVSGCASFSIPPGTNNYTEPTLPPVGMVLHYLVRSTAPHVGSWGYNSARVERAVPCVP